MNLKIPYFRQPTDTTCGPACTRIVLSYYGIKDSDSYLEKEEKTNKRGTKHSLLIKAIKRAGCRTIQVTDSSLSKLKKYLNMQFPVIINYLEPKTNESHYAVAKGSNKKGIFLADPYIGNNFFITNSSLLSRWHNEQNTSKDWMLVILPPKNFLKIKK